LEKTSIKLIVIVVMAAFLSTASVCISPVKAQTTPYNILYSVPITITNYQSTSTSVPFQQMITVDSSLYSSFEAYNLKNVEFYDSFGNVIPSWLESGATYYSTNTVYWLKLPNGISSYSSVTVYMGFASTTTNLFDGYTVGEAPQLSSNYGQYDNGANIFTNYWNFAGSYLPSGWISSGAVSVNDGLTLSNGGTLYYNTALSLPYAIESDMKQTVLSGTNAYGILVAATASASPSPPSGQYYGTAIWSISSSGAGFAPYINGVWGTSSGLSSANTYYILSFAASSTGTYYQANYGTAFTTTSASKPTTSYISLGTPSSTSQTHQWIRIRNLSPNGVMPAVTFGSVSSTSQTTAPTVTLYTPTINGLTVTVNGVAEAASGATISSINWNWGDSYTSYGSFPLSHTYSTSGYCTITVTATDSNGLSSSAHTQAYIQAVATPTPTYSGATPAYAFNGANAEYRISASYSGVSIS
jgi:hypothetical protein